MSILDQLADAAKKRVEQAKEQTGLEEIKARAQALPKGDFRFEKALKKEGLSFICECKKASPSKGLIANEYHPAAIAAAYEKAGANCISVLTEPKWFLGSGQDLQAVRQSTSLPVLRKDFTVDSYMIYEAKVLGADAVLLIAAILSDEQLAGYLQICEELGLSALCEAHDEKEISRLLKAGARIIGVNNRNLKDFSVNAENALNLHKNLPEEIVFVSESGIQTREQTEALEKAGIEAVLIGETLMKADDKTAMLKTMKGIGA